MLRHKRRLEPVDEAFEGGEMIGVGLHGSRQRHSDTVQRKRPLAADILEHGEARTALHHVIFSVNLEPKSRRRRGQSLGVMLGLEANTGGGSHGQRPLIATSEPLPLGVLIEAQVPLATYFQASPW